MTASRQPVRHDSLSRKRPRHPLAAGR